MKLPSETAGGCPSVEQIAALAEGSLAAAERPAVVSHVAACADCRELLAETIRTLSELAAEGAPAGGARVLPTTFARSGGWRLAAVAAVMACAIGAAVTYRVLQPPPPPARAELLASLPPAADLLHDVWGGRVTRGAGDEGQLARQSAELGALLVDLDVSVAGGDDPRTSELLRRIAAIVESAGLLDPDVAMLRGLAALARPALAVSEQRAELAALEGRLGQRFLPFQLSLGGFAEATRLGALAGDFRTLDLRSSQKYLRWLLRQAAEPLSAEVREQVLVISSSQSDPAARRAACEALLRALTS